MNYVHGGINVFTGINRPLCQMSILMFAFNIVWVVFTI